MTIITKTQNNIEIFPQFPLNFLPSSLQFLLIFSSDPLSINRHLQCNKQKPNNNSRNKLNNTKNSSYQVQSIRIIRFHLLPLRIILMRSRNNEYILNKNQNKVNISNISQINQINSLNQSRQRQNMEHLIHKHMLILQQPIQLIS